MSLRGTSGLNGLFRFPLICLFLTFLVRSHRDRVVMVAFSRSQQYGVVSETGKLKYISVPPNSILGLYRPERLRPRPCYMYACYAYASDSE